MFEPIIPCLRSAGKGCFVRRMFLSVVLAAGVCAVAPSVARADALDPFLIQKSSGVLDRLYTAKVKNVGVLPFRVTKGTDKPSFIAAPICAGMTIRLENALIMSNSLAENETIGILSNVGTTATKNGVGNWFTNEAERKKLFAQSYPMAWGNLKASPDALLTGEIFNVGERTETKVVIEVIYRTDPKKLVKVAEFEVDTDRSLMTDLGYNFSLSRVARRGKGDNRDRMVASLVRRRSAKEPGPTEVESGTPENVGGMSVGIQYNGKPIEIKPVSTGAVNSEYFVPPVEAGTAFTMTLTYNGKQTDKLGVIVKLNGRSSFNEEQGDSLLLRKWLYTPERNKDKPDLFTGFTYEGPGDNVKLFKVLTAEESEARESQLGDRVGWIEVDVFASAPSKDDADEVKTISARGAVLGKAKSAKEARDQVLKANGLEVGKEVRRNKLDEAGTLKRGAIVPSEKATQAALLSFGSLPNPVHVGSLRIRYYNPTKTPAAADGPTVISPPEEK